MRGSGRPAGRVRVLRGQDAHKCVHCRMQREPARLAEAELEDEGVEGVAEEERDEDLRERLEEQRVDRARLRRLQPGEAHRRRGWQWTDSVTSASDLRRIEIH
jgi:hypothetical protein